MNTDSLNRLIEQDSETFRDSIRSISADGGRNWVYAKKPSGRFTRAREVVAVFLLALFFSGPFLTVNGQPVLLLNILERTFIVFGMAFWPADFHLLALGALSLLLFLVLFTAVYGRIWCGWACPQTIFLEMVFRRIEYWIEGDRAAQIRLDKQPWNREKVLRKGGKHAVYFGLSFVIANLFLAYVIGKDELWTIITDPILEHWVGLTAITVFSFIFYLVFARFREQVCHFACPYGRHQSVMVDEDSLSVSYDFKRGELRANPKERFKNPATSYGSCIDCGECVRVCPMGIDIRNGIQLECTQCTACIDACDTIMDKIEEPRGLIRYASLNQIRTGTKRFFTPRIAGYSVVLAIVLSLFVVFFSMRTDTESIILRAPGVLYSTLADGRISNLYDVTVLNKTFETLPVDIRVEKPAGAEIRLIGDFTTLRPQAIQEGRFLLIIPKTDLTPTATEVEFVVMSGDREIERITSSFIGPQTLD
jgi:cytochrome c oxidase accessory protein FixG